MPFQTKKLTNSDKNDINEDTSAQELALKFMPFAEAIVTKVSKSLQLPLHLREEFVAAAYFGLVEAATRFDSSLNIPFERYAYIRIRGAVIDYIRSSSDLSGSAYRLAQRLNDLHEFSRVGGEDLNEFGLNQKTYQQARTESTQSNLTFRVSLTDMGPESSELIQHNPDPENSLMEKQERKSLWQHVQDLPTEQAQIIEKYYLQDISFTDIAEGVSACSKSWVCRLHQRALNNLKEMLSA